jgi:hypothetical protein
MRRVTIGDVAAEKAAVGPEAIVLARDQLAASSPPLAREACRACAATRIM